MQLITHLQQDYMLRLATDDDVAAIRILVNSAYQELSNMGLNYLAADQDEERTRERMNQGRAFVLLLDEEIVGTILLSVENYFTNLNTAYIGQFAIRPSFKRQGLGSILMTYCEELACKEGFHGVQLCTATSAEHLVEWYLKLGYKQVGITHFEGRNFDSCVLEKLFTSD